jgi:ElaB/YqjD/DUF883 family membrane-anchored ribosome-binding protein
MSFVSSLVGGILGSNAVNDAANAEVQGAQQAQKVSQTNQTNANAAQQTALTNVTAAEQPYQALGQTSANSLADLVNKGFSAPTLQQAEQTPGYEFNLQQGTQAIDENAAANGTLMSGNTGVALEQFGQGLAQNTYQQAYNNALNAYMANYQSLQGATNTGLSSTGQLAGANLQTAGNTANIDLTAAQQQMQQINNAAAARASGYLGSANVWSNAVGGMMPSVGDVAQGLSGGGGLSDVMSSLEGGMFA